MLQRWAVLLAGGAHGAPVSNVCADTEPEHRDGRAMGHGGDTLVSGVKDVEDTLPERLGNDQAVIVQEKAVALEHSVTGLPVRAAQRRVVGHALPEGRDHVRVFQR